MSDETAPTPSVLVPETPLPPVTPPTEPAAPLKPLLNPLQNDGPPPSSTIVEPPKSPNPSNPATDEKGNRVGVLNGGGSTEAPPTMAGATVPAAASSSLPLQEATPLTPAERDPTTLALPADSPADATLEAQTDLPPLPIDASVPPSPKAADEPPPPLPADAIPPAVTTPSVIITEEQEAKERMMGVESSLEATPAPAGPEITSASPLPAGPPVAQPVHEAMDVDAVGEEEAQPASLESTSSVSSLKRAGEELNGERDEKRVREDAPINGVPSLQVEPEPLPVVAVGGPVPPPAWESYVPPPPRAAGPTTPLTPTQHKHMLSAVRALKKRIPDAYAFLDPVDVVKFNIPHYNQVIDRPMDLSTIETKLVVSDPRGPPKDKSKMSKWDLSKGRYNSVSEVVQDVRQIWENTRKFNGRDHVVSISATKLEEGFEKSLANLPAEPAPAVFVPPTPPAAPAAGPSTARRPSISHPPAIRRTSDGPDASRPKREIHPPPSKDLAYEDGTKKPKRRNDPQIQWVNKTLKNIEGSNKHFLAVSPFLYPIEQIIEQIPDYLTVVKKPIDLNHIKGKLAENVYDEVAQVDADIRLMISNALKFNPPGHEVHTSATQLLQIWDEKWRSLPPKQEPRDSSEDPLAEEYVEEGYSSAEDGATLRNLEGQVSRLNDQIAALRAKMTKGRLNKSQGTKSKKPKAGPSQRKQSVSKHSPGVNGNGHAKKAKKAKEPAFKDEDDDMESDEEPTTMTLTQKQELAEKIQIADADTLQKAITIIQTTTSVGANGEEIELDIDTLPVATVIKLYNLVCRGGARGKPGGGRAKPSAGGQGKKPRKAMGGPNKRSVNEREENERIKRMEEQLNAFDSRGGGGGPSMGYEGGDDSSSEEESSDEE